MGKTSHRPRKANIPLILQPHIIRTSPDPLLPVILPFIPQPDPDKQEETDAPADDNRDFGGDVTRGV